MLRSILGVGLLALVTGCEPKPRAPSLENEAVFQDNKLNVRFVAPEGWVLFARSSVPPGPVTKPIRIVAYHRGSSDGGADLELYIADFPANKPLMEYLKEHPVGPEKWKETGTPTPLQLEASSGIKHQLVSVHQAHRQREIWEFRRKGDRVYLMICSAMTADRSTRDQAERAVKSITFPQD
jgi:hypothetical protein